MAENSSVPKVAVIGAGPAGLTAAYELTKSGVGVDLYEASQQVGGMTRSFSLWGQRVDLGPHRFFSRNPRVSSTWKEMVGDDFRMVNRSTRILYESKFYEYPLKPFDAFLKLGPARSLMSGLSYLVEKIKPPPEVDNFETWVSHRFGRRLFKTFFESYSEKLWGIPCSELDSDFAVQRIKKLSLYEVLVNGLTLRKDNKHTSLVSRFAYPKQGAGQPYEKMKEFVLQQGQSIFFNSKVSRVVIEQGRVKGLTVGDKFKEYQHVISTMPLTHLLKGIEDVPFPVKQACEQLKFRNTIIVYLRVKDPYLFSDQWLYIHDAKLKMGRVTNFRNWAPELNGDSQDTILALEYWCDREDPLWIAKDEDLIKLASSEISLSGLTDSSLVSDGHVCRVPNCYPVYRIGYKEHLDRIIGFIKSIHGLEAIGRYGSFKYNNQDHSILMGLLAADNYLKRGNTDLWNINTDLEYQE